MRQAGKAGTACIKNHLAVLHMTGVLRAKPNEAALQLSNSIHHQQGRNRGRGHDVLRKPVPNQTSCLMMLVFATDDTTVACVVDQEKEIE